MSIPINMGIYDPLDGRLLTSEIVKRFYDVYRNGAWGKYRKKIMCESFYIGWTTFDLKPNKRHTIYKVRYKVPESGLTYEYLV